jgi:hypothetical protein
MHCIQIPPEYKDHLSTYSEPSPPLPPAMYSCTPIGPGKCTSWKGLPAYRHLCYVPLELFTGQYT